MYPLTRAQIAHLKVDKVPIKVSNRYADLIDVFSEKLAIKLSEYIEINNHAIKLAYDQ